MHAGANANESGEIENLITDLVLSRMAAVRSTNPDLADGYEQLAVHGHVNPALYAAVLRFAGQAISVSRLDMRGSHLPDAA